MESNEQVKGSLGDPKPSVEAKANDAKGPETTGLGGNASSPPDPRGTPGKGFGVFAGFLLSPPQDPNGDSRYVHAYPVTGNSINCHMPYGGLGDMLCLIAAARAYGLKHGCKVYVHAYPEVQKAYPDYEQWGSEKLIPGARDVQVHAAVVERHRVKNKSADGNYLGTFLAALCLPPNEPPRLELPELPVPVGLQAGGYVAIQPYSTFARNPKDRDAWCQCLVNTTMALYPNLPVVCVGAPNTRQDLLCLDWDHLGGPLELLAVVQHAAWVLTPRSVTAHVAAAYGISSFVWVPGDGEDWHLNYPGWPHMRTSVDTDHEALRSLYIGWLEE